MGPGNLGHCLHRFHAQEPQIGLPAGEPEQRIMIGTEPRGQTLPGAGLVEQAAERWTIDGNRPHAKADDPAGKLIHHDQHSVTLQQNRFGPEQVQTPETVFGMPQEREPRRSVVTAFRVVVGGQNSADHIFVEVDANGLGQVLRNLRAAELGIAPLDFTEGLDPFRGGPFWTRLLLRSGGVEEWIFELLEATMKAQQGSGLEDDDRIDQPTRAQELGTKPEEQAVGGAKIGCSAAGALQDQELLFQEDILSENGSGSANSQENGQFGQQMHQ